MKLFFLTICLFVLGSYSLYSQKILLLTNEKNRDKVGFLVGDKIVLKADQSGKLSGRINAISDTAIIIEDAAIQLNDIDYLREKKTSGIVFIKVVGTLVGAFFLIGVLDNETYSPDPEQKARYAVFSAIGFSSLFLHPQKYHLKKHWKASVENVKPQ